MIVKANDVKGLPVISIDSGSRLEDVDSTIYDPETHTILGLVVRPKGIFSDPQVIELRDVVEIGKDVVTVQSAGVIKEANRVSDKIYSLIQMDKHFLNNSIITQDGEKLGKVSDFYFDSHSGLVGHFEVSQGLLGNAASGKKSIAPADIVTLGQDVTVVKTQTREVIKEQEGTQGLAGTFSDIKEKTTLKMDNLLERTQQPAMQDKKQVASDNLQSAKETVVDKFQQLKQTVSAKADETKSSIQDKQAASATGKFLTKTVFDPVTNTPIAQRGEMVDYTVVNTARERGILDQVVDNVSDTPVQ